jgi:predicted GIY-YIG superfamily endonuclease
MNHVHITVQEAVEWTGQPDHRLINLLDRGIVEGFRLQRMIRFNERSLGAHYGLPLPGPRELELHPPAPPEPAPPEPFPWVRRDVDHWLYWFYDAEGTLLYVGITNSGVKRMEQHGAEKLWWPKVSHIAVDHFPTRDEALAAEDAAIRKHEPLHNLTHGLARRSA